MCHEMVHLYCLVNEIQDTCQKGRYHNKTFKAEARDLEIGYDRTVGFSHTNPTEAFRESKGRTRKASPLCLPGLRAGS
jgi:hypothetical protein